MKAPNCTKWVPFFKLMYGKFGLRLHIDGSKRHPPLILDQVEYYFHSRLFGLMTPFRISPWKTMTKPRGISGSPLKASFAQMRNLVPSSSTTNSTP